MRMCHQEVKQEHKEVEGNPQMNGRMRARQRDAANRRSIAAVPKACLLYTSTLACEWCYLLDRDHVPVEPLPTFELSGASPVLRRFPRKSFPLSSAESFAANRVVRHFSFHNLDRPCLYS